MGLRTPIRYHARKVGEGKRPAGTTDHNDGGESIQRQLLRSSAGFRRLDRLPLTHSHFDHALGIPGLFSTLRLRQSSDPMTIHGGPGTLDVIVRLLAGLWGEGRAPIPLECVPLSEGQVFDASDRRLLPGPPP